VLIKKDDSNDFLSKLAYNLMVDSLNTMHNFAKDLLSNLAFQNTRAYMKGLESYYKEFYKRKAKIDSEKPEVLHFPPPSQPLVFADEGVLIEEKKEDNEDGIIIKE